METLDFVEQEIQYSELDPKDYVCVFFDSGVCAHGTKKPEAGEVTELFCSECEDRVSPNPPRISYQ